MLVLVILIANYAFSSLRHEHSLEIARSIADSQTFGVDICEKLSVLSLPHSNGRIRVRVCSGEGWAHSSPWATLDRW